MNRAPGVCGVQHVPGHFRQSLLLCACCREKHTRKRLSLESDNASLRESLHQLQLKLQQEDQWKTSVEGTCKVLQQDKNHLNAKCVATNACVWNVQPVLSAHVWHVHYSHFVCVCLYVYVFICVCLCLFVCVYVLVFVCVFWLADRFT